MDKSAPTPWHSLCCSCFCLYGWSSYSHPSEGVPTNARIDLRNHLCHKCRIRSLWTSHLSEAWGGPGWRFQELNLHFLSRTVLFSSCDVMWPSWSSYKFMNFALLNWCHKNKIICRPKAMCVWFWQPCASQRRQRFFLISASEMKFRVSDVAITWSHWWLCSMQCDFSSGNWLPSLPYMHPGTKKTAFSLQPQVALPTLQVAELPREIKPSQRQVLSILDHPSISMIQVFI